MILAQLDHRRFDALAGYARQPLLRLITKEIDWFSTPDERVLGTLLFDLIDEDFSWVVFGRDATQRFRAINVNASYASAEEAYEALMEAIRSASAQSDESFHQGDEESSPIDFFEPAVAENRFNPSFKILLEDRRYSPARQIIEAMMRYYQDVDGNFIQKFQAAGFDALLWELYLFATFTELGFVRDGENPTPDFVLNGNLGSLAVEATSVNPSSSSPAFPETDQAFREYLENYIPIRLSTALRNKLNHKPPYWQNTVPNETPFCIAIQDFHTLGAMRMIVPAITEYVFGVRHWIEDGERRIAKIKTHRFKGKTVQSGFFELPNSENVSAILVNPQGTITKFNRLGLAAGFGDPTVRMLRTGMRRNDGNLQSPQPRPFREVISANSTEGWVEGMVVLHNPNANIPLNPELIPGAAHEFLQPDGSIMSMLPDFHPLYSETLVVLNDETGADDRSAI